jgi:hypothetical protein
MIDESIKLGVQQVAQTLYDKHGRVVPSELVDAAKPKDSPAHDGFEWDNKKAGDKYRLYQARNWCRKIEIRVESCAQPERLINVPRIIQANDEDSREGEYQLPSVLIQRPDEFQRAMEQAQIKVAAAKRALDELYNAAERTNRNDQAAVIAQMARATDLWSSALSALH